MNKLFMSIRIASKALRRNLMRSLLTMLGVIIGVAAVIVMVSLGEGAAASIQEEIAAAGTNLIMVRAGSASMGGIRQGGGSRTTLTAADAAAIQNEVAAVSQVAVTIRTGAQMVYASQNWNASVQGTSQDFPAVRRWEVKDGSFFTLQDVQASTRVAVLGTSVVENLFGNEDPLGKIIRIKNVPFKVVGIMASKGQTSWGNDQDDIVLAPYTTVQRKLMGVQHVSEILVSAAEPRRIPEATEQIIALLRQRHRILPPDEDDFSVRTQEEMAQIRVGASNAMSRLLASIASISLLVGGIGIMNIMLVSVTERTREIGLRMSVGARARDILWQFLVEAVTLSALGGIAGIALGAGIARVVGESLDWSTHVSTQSVLLSFGFAAAIGIFFGFYPARKASQLDPIEALRYE
ncbi:MAG: ABC transporter permease [Vicinamibacteria bacterium]